MARSYLFIPGNVPRMLQNMDVYEADVIIIDWEDAIAPGEKDEARILSETFLKKHAPDVEIYIRINAEPSLYEADLAHIPLNHVKGVVYPKSDTASLSKLLKVLPDSLDIIALIETPGAFFDIKTIAAMERISALFLGAEDLCSELGATRDPSGDAILFARSTLIMAAKAYGKDAVDTPWADLDANNLQKDAARAKNLGFDAKSAIHPNQVPLINRLFSPGAEQIKDAKRIIAMHERKGTMRFSLDGKMVDKPIIQRAYKLLEKARRYGLDGGDSVD